jgi:hypothetical protein
LTTTQFYREPRGVDDAGLEIEVGTGKKYDPKVIEAFKKALPAMKKVREAYADALGDMINLDFAPKGQAPAPGAAAAQPAAPKPAAATKPDAATQAAAKASSRADARRK